MGGVKTEKNENPAFKQIFPIFLTWLLCKLQFLIPKVNSASPPPAQMLLAKLCLWLQSLHSVTKVYTKAQHNLKKKTLTSHILQIKNFIHYTNTLKYYLCKNNADVITKCIHVDI
jgi:hypothetical protein